MSEKDLTWTGSIRMLVKLLYVAAMLTEYDPLGVVRLGVIDADTILKFGPANPGSRSSADGVRETSEVCPVVENELVALRVT